MEGREAQHHQPLNLCQLLYTFFMKFFARKTFRAVALKTPTSNDCTEVPIYDSSPPWISSTTRQIKPFATLEQINGWENSYPFSSSSSITDHRAGGKGSSPAEKSGDAFVEIAIDGSAGEKDKEEEEEAKAPKKMVSINDNVEDINSIMKQRGKSKLKKADSFGHEQDQDHYPKRLRSILRVSSGQNETSLSILS